MKEILIKKEQIEKENEELKRNCSMANEKLKEYNEIIKDKYESMIIEINKQKEEKENLEKKYKSMIKQIKNKEKDIKKENKDLKQIINNQENNSQLNKTMFNSPINNNIINDNSNSIMIPKIEDPNDTNQKKALEEFKDLLKKIDEKLEINV